MRVGIYARVSTSNGSQTCENQLFELRRYCEARGWTVYAEYTDEMSGAKDRRPGLIDCSSTPVERESRSSCAGRWIGSDAI